MIDGGHIAFDHRGGDCVLCWCEGPTFEHAVEVLTLDERKQLIAGLVGSFDCADEVRRIASRILSKRAEVVR